MIAKVFLEQCPICTQGKRCKGHTDKHAVYKESGSWSFVSISLLGKSSAPLGKSRERR